MDIIVDVEADGPCPGLYSMVSFGAVCLHNTNLSFYGRTAPISNNWVPEALAVSNTTREEHMGYEDPLIEMNRFMVWLDNISDSTRFTFISDNPAFDWQFINYYFHEFIGTNPFGFSARRIGDFYAGKKDKWKDHTSWKKFRKTKHTHNPVDDAKGNAEALKHILSI